MLKIDLLPAHYAVARMNRRVIFLSIPLLVGVAVLWLAVMVKMNGDISRTTDELAKTKQEADIVRKLQEETKSRQAELDPIQAKVKFVQDADVSGLPFWDRFHKINQYIYDRAVVRNFSITPPGSVSFSVELTSTEDAGRFILNLIRCPYITGINISGSPVQGGVIEGAKGGAAPAAGGAPGGMPGAPGMPGGPGPGMPGAPGGPAPGMPGMPGEPGGAPGGPPGMASPGGAPAAGTTAGPITLTVNATLLEPISIPTPPQPAGAAAGGEGMGGGPGGMPGGPAAGPGGPGGGPGGPSGPGGGGPKSGEGGGSKKGGGDEDGGGGGLKKGGGGGGDEA